MKKRKWITLLLTISMAVSAGLTGCSKDEATKADTEQYLTTVSFEQKTLDINDAEDVNSAEIIAETMEGLVRIESDGSGDIIKPAGAKDWKVSDDGLTYTFYLRDYKWTDDQPVTAQQYVDSWLRLLNPEKGFGYAYFAWDILNAKKYSSGECKAEQVGVKAIDDKTLEVKLERPTPYFIKKVGFKNLFPIRMDIVNAEGDKYGSDFTKLVFNGPFIITEYISNNKVVLEKNQKYWDAEHVKMNKITMQDIQEMSTQMQMFESHQLDITGTSQNYLKGYIERAEKGEFSHATGYRPSTSYFYFNVKNGGPSGLFTNKKIRQAFGLIINREDICKNMYQRYVPAYGYCPYAIKNGDKEYRKEVKEPMLELKKNYDTIDKVAGLFKEGLQELGKDPNGSYTVKYLSSGTDSVSKSFQEYYQNTFQKLPGVKIELVVAADTNQYYDMQEEMDYDLSNTGWTGDYDDPMTFFDMWITGSGNNEAKYSSSEYDKLMNEEIYKETDNKKRMDIFAQSEKILIDDGAISPYMYLDTHRFVHNYVKDAQFPMFGATYELKYAYTEGRN